MSILSCRGTLKEVLSMRIGVNLGPTGDWPAMLTAAQTADTSGFDALSFLDHYHTDKLEWPYICGWSAYGALAMATSRIHLVPMVIDRLNYLVPRFAFSVNG